MFSPIFLTISNKSARIECLLRRNEYSSEQLLGTTNEVTLRLPCDKSNTVVASIPRQNGTSMSAGKRRRLPDMTFVPFFLSTQATPSLRALATRRALHSFCFRGIIFLFQGSGDRIHPCPLPCSFHHNLSSDRADSTRYNIVYRATCLTLYRA